LDCLLYFGWLVWAAPVLLLQPLLLLRLLLYVPPLPHWAVPRKPLHLWLRVIAS
jgi:hypothetical protein